MIRSVTSIQDRDALAELRAMMSDRRLVDPVKFAHIRQELGIDPPVTPIDMGI
jgi:hypothetical protein